MRVRFDGVERRGQALDLRDLDISPETVLQAIRDPDDERVRAGTPETEPDGRVGGVSGLHRRVGFLRSDMTVSPVPAVAAAARTRGASTEHDDELRRIDEELASCDAPTVDLAAARQQVADTAADVERLREKVARASGRVEARREDGEDATDAQAVLQSATRELAERETEYHAATEALAAARQRARDARDARERRLELEDRRGNLRRAARRALADAAADSFRRALAALPILAEPSHPADFEGPGWTAACAVARMGRVSAPLVVAAPFESTVRARAALDARVLLVEV